jgi:hypothetical protein
MPKIDPGRLVSMVRDWSFAPGVVMRGQGGLRRLSGVVRLIGLCVMCLALANCASSKLATRTDQKTRSVAAAAEPSLTHKLQRTAHNAIVCDDRGCSKNAVYRADAVARESYASVDWGMVVGDRPDGCPHAYCGCEASRYVFGKVRPELNLASNWLRFPRATPAPGMAAVRNHHVMVLMSHAGGNDWLVHDGNAGNGKTREHVMSLSGYVVVNPNGG